MSVSKKWFDWALTTWKRPGPTEIINCSEAEILTDHCSLMPLSEAIFKYCNKKINVDWTIKKNPKITTTSSFDKLRTGVGAMIVR